VKGDFDIGFGDLHTGGHHIVDHSGERVDAIDVDEAAGAECGAPVFEIIGGGGGVCVGVRFGGGEGKYPPTDGEKGRRK